MSEFNPDPDHLAAAGEAAALLKQGSIIEVGVSAWLADLAAPLTAEAFDEAGDPDGGPVTAGNPVMVGRIDWQWSMVLTQTCDLARTPAAKPLVQICPVYQVEQGSKTTGERPQYVRVPWHTAPCEDGNEWVADLQEVTTLERTLLPTEGDQERRPVTADDRRMLAYLIARYYGRAALPNAVSTALKNLTEKVRNRYTKDDSPIAVIFNNIDQVRVRSEPDFDEAAPWALTVFFLIPDRLGDFADTETVSPASSNAGRATSALSEAIKEHCATAAAEPIPRRVWIEGISEILTNTKTSGDVTSVVARVTNMLNTDDWTHSDELDLAYLSNSIESETDAT